MLNSLLPGVHQLENQPCQIRPAGNELPEIIVPDAIAHCIAQRLGVFFHRLIDAVVLNATNDISLSEQRQG